MRPTAQTDRKPRRPGQLGQYAWLPIPLLLALIAGLWVADSQTVYESRALMVFLNLFFTWLVSVCISLLTARGFLGSGRPALLMFGCGSILWGTTSLAAATIVGSNVNPTITVHNLGILGAAACYFAGLLWRGRLPRPGRWLAAGYAAALIVSALIFLSATQGLTPIFFIQGQGGTLVREVVLLLTTALFVWVAWQMIYKYRRQAGEFSYWYGLGLALTATGLTGLMLLSVQGSLLGWASRLTQFLGSAYLFVGALVAAREKGSWTQSLGSLDEPGGKGVRPCLEQRPALRWLCRYLLAAVTVAAAIGLHLALGAWVGPGLPPFITFYPSIMVVVLLSGFGPGILANLIMVLTAAYWILPPVGQFTIASFVDRLSLVIFFSTNLVVCVLAELYRRNRDHAAVFEREAALNESREILRQQAELIDPVRAEIIAREMLRVLRERNISNTGAVESEVETNQRVPSVAGATVAGVGLVVLAGWALGLEPLKSLLPGLATMKANTALCFLLAGSALALRDNRVLRLFCAGMVCTVSALTLTEYLTVGDYGFDQILFGDPNSAVYPGRMSQITAIGFLLSGASLLLLKSQTRSALMAQQALAFLAALLGIVACLGYFYNVQQLYRVAGYTSMALHTAASLVLLAIGLLFARSDGFGWVLTHPGPGAQLSRLLLPAALVVPAVAGYLTDLGRSYGFYGDGMDTALFVLLMAIVLWALVWWSALVLNKGDAVRREAEAEQSNLNEVMNHAHEPLIVRELGGVIRVWNHGAEALYGWPASEALGLRKQDLLRTEGEGHMVEEIDRQLEIAGRWEGELVQTTHDGRQVTVESRQTARHVGEGRLLILESNLDITERRQSDEALRKSRERLDLALTSSKMATFDLDIVKNKRTWSDGVHSLLGTKPEDFTGTAEEFFQVMHPDDRSTVQAALASAIESAGEYSTEYRVVWPNGSIHHISARGKVHCDAAGQPDILTGVCWDITERKQAEVDLLAANRSLRDSRVAALNLMKDAVEACKKAEQAEKDLQNVNDHLELRVMERTRDLEEALQDLLEESAERVQAVEALREKEQMLIQQSRQAAMGEMIGNIAHQWRQPLNTLALSVQEVKVMHDLGECTGEFMNQSVEKSMGLIQHMSQTIDDFRDYFKPQKDKTEFKLSEVIASTLLLVEDSFKHKCVGIEIVTRDTPSIVSYRNEFAQSLLNILNNARDVLTERKIEHPKVIVTVFSEGDRAVVTVADNAGGIPGDIIDKIFDPYFTTKGPQAGTGLGLFMSKAIVEKNLGGSLTARNTHDGAEFRIEV